MPTMTPTNPPELEFTSQWVRAQPVVTSYIYGLIRNRHDAEDLLQEVAGEAFTNFGRYDPGQSFIAWTMTIARHRMIDHFRRRRVSRELFDEQTLGALAAAHERLGPQEGDRRQALERCLATLGERGRAAIDLRYQKNEPVTRIADLLRTSPTTVSTLLYKARRALAECITRHVSAAEEGRR
jgi:RNA polymerase sigma-70 factor (ECF subfamily)